MTIATMVPGICKLLLLACYSFVLFRPDDINAQSLESIQRSVALICLDQPNPDIRAVQDNTLFTHNAMTATCARGLHGNGVTRNSGNRWFDKPMQVLL